MDKLEIRIQNGNTVYVPVVQDGIAWETERKGVPGKLTFRVLRDAALHMREGNRVIMTVGETDVFFGFIFTQNYTKSGLVAITAYDQLRYLKNKDVMWYENKKASDIVRQLALDFLLQVGEIEDTGYVIAYREESNVALFDIIQKALDLTFENNKKIFVLYDEFGKLTLKGAESMKLDLLIDEETAADFNHSSSIDSRTYTRVKLYRDNKSGDPRQREEFFSPLAPDGRPAISESIKAWGVLQYCASINEAGDGQQKADTLLSIYNRKSATFSISGALGDLRVRAGSSVMVKLDHGDVKVADYFLVEKCTHAFKENLHTMNLTLRGGDFFA